MSFKTKKTAAAPTRHVHVASVVNDHWHRDGRHRFELGFLIGQSDLLTQEDVVLAAVEVPSEAPDLDHDIEVVQGFEDLSVDWVQEIARQINRLLPGGVDITGLYVVSLADARSSIDQASVYLRAIVSALALPAEFQQAGDAQEPEHHCIVHICSKTSKKSVQSFANLRDVPRTTTVAAELTSPSSSERLQMKTFVSSVAIDEAIAFSQLTVDGRGADAVEEIAEKRLDELQQQLQPLAQRIWGARGVSAGGDAAEEQIELLTTTSAALGTEQTGASAAKESSGRCRGVVKCVAYVPASEPRAVELATFFLKRDLVKSLLARVELLLERFADDGAAGDASALVNGGLLRLPKRGLANWRSGATLTTAALQLSVLALPEDDEGWLVQNTLEILSAGDELPGIDIDDTVKSLRWLESDSEATETTSAVSASAPGVVVSPGLSHPSAAAQQLKQKDAGSSALFIVLPIVLLLLALLLAQQLK